MNPYAVDPITDEEYRTGVRQVHGPLDIDQAACARIAQGFTDATGGQRIIVPAWFAVRLDPAVRDLVDVYDELPR